jgi:hypothetical protein
VFISDNNSPDRSGRLMHNDGGAFRIGEGNSLGGHRATAGPSQMLSERVAGKRYYVSKALQARINMANLPRRPKIEFPNQLQTTAGFLF